MKMWYLKIHIKKNDSVSEKKIQTLIMNILIEAGIAGATVWTGVNGFGKRGRSNLRLEGVT